MSFKAALIFLASCLLLLSCQQEEKKTSIPAGILPPKKMAAFLKDIHQTESVLLLSGIRQDSSAELFKDLEKDILKKHKLDTGKVNRSLRYYTTNIEMLDSLYSMIGKEPDSTFSNFLP
jgi:hypothetical protein